MLLALLLALAVFAWWISEQPPQEFSRGPNAIIVHHSATPLSVGGRPIDAKALDEMHARRGFRTFYAGKEYHIGYHYVILPDGTVQPGRPEKCVGAHARRANDSSLGICLVGNFSSAHNRRGENGLGRPSAAQLEALVRLCAELVGRHAIAPENVKLHRDVGQTACPGDRFPAAAFRAKLRRALDAGQ